MSDAPVLIFGGVGGIGEAIARRLVAADVAVTVTSRDEARAATLAREIGCGAARADVTDEESVVAAIASTAPDGRLGGIVYAVGSIPLKPLARITSEDLLAAWQVNVAGATLALKHAAPALKAGSGSVVLFSSVAARQGFPNHAIIGPMKAAVEGLALAAAAELAPLVRVNAIAPSLTRTPLAAALTSNEKIAEALAELHPLKRLGEADDIAALAAFLLSGDAAWITGQVFAVDGGRGSLRVGKG